MNRAAVAITVAAVMVPLGLAWLACDSSEKRRQRQASEIVAEGLKRGERKMDVLNRLTSAGVPIRLVADRQTLGQRVSHAGSSVLTEKWSVVIDRRAGNPIFAGMGSRERYATLGFDSRDVLVSVEYEWGTPSFY